MNARTAAGAAGGGLLHRIDARAKLITLPGLAVVITSFPAEDHRGLAGCAVLLASLVLAAEVEWERLGRRLLHLAPFLLLVVALPFARPAGGLDQAIGQAAKALLGCTALVVLAATTPADRLLAGLAALRCPALVVLTLSMMVRYLDLLGEEAVRLRRAAMARGYSPRFLWQAGLLGRLVGVLFLRSHARAERVHGAMLARGFDADRPAAGPPAAWEIHDVAFIILALGTMLAWRLARP